MVIIAYVLVQKAASVRGLYRQRPDRGPCRGALCSCSDATDSGVAPPLFPCSSICQHHSGQESCAGAAGKGCALLACRVHAAKLKDEAGKACGMVPARCFRCRGQTAVEIQQVAFR